MRHTQCVQQRSIVGHQAARDLGLFERSFQLGLGLIGRSNNVPTRVVELVGVVRQEACQRECAVALLWSQFVVGLDGSDDFVLDKPLGDASSHEFEGRDRNVPFFQEFLKSRREVAAKC